MSDDIASASNAAPSEAVTNEAAPVQTEQASESAQQSLQLDKPSATTRDALEKAFKTVEAEPDKLASEQAEKKTRNPNKDPDTGKFTTAPKPDAAKAPQAKPDATQVEVKPDATQAKPAPTRFSKAAQDAWGQTPEPVRAEVERAIGELTQGIEKYRGVAEAFAPVEKYHQMAQQSGTTLEKALDAYVGIENTWRQSPARGFAEVCKNMGVAPDQMLSAIVGEFQRGGVPQTRGDTPEVAQLKQQLQSFEQRFGTIEKTMTEAQQQAKQSAALQSVEQFAEKHPHFDEVAESIAQMLDTGFAKDLTDAYAKAIRLNPEVAAKVAADQGKPATPDPAQTREKAGKSITGSPSAGSHLASTTIPASSPREALTKAFAQVGAAI